MVGIQLVFFFSGQLFLSTCKQRYTVIIIIIIIIANFYTRFSHEAQSAYSVLLPRSLDIFQCRTYTVHNFHSQGAFLPGIAAYNGRWQIQTQ